jgi:hypothetical protein
VTETVTQIIARLAVFTDEQRSLAFCPMPRRELVGPCDSRMGGDLGLDLNCESFRNRVIRAKFRFRKHEGAK